jgi:hypothetical protein
MILWIDKLGIDETLLATSWAWLTDRTSIDFAFLGLNTILAIKSRPFCALSYSFSWLLEGSRRRLVLRFV